MNDAEKLRMLAHWFDLLDAELDGDTDPEIQDFLRKIADTMGDSGDSDERHSPGIESNDDMDRPGPGRGNDMPAAEIYLLPVDKRSKGVCLSCRKWIDDCTCANR